MKTGKEILDFYGVEVGKVYIVTKTHSLSVEPYRNLKFTVQEDKDYNDGFSVYFIIKKYGSIARLSCLCQLEYKEVKPEILDEKEKEYLSAVIKPFRKQILYIAKTSCVTKTNNGKSYIYIQLPCDHMWFPYFESDTMYKGMEPDKKYTLEELGL